MELKEQLEALKTSLEGKTSEEIKTAIKGFETEFKTAVEDQIGEVKTAMQTEIDALKESGQINTSYPIMETPLKTLIKGITSMDDVTSFHFIDRKNKREISK